jgi:shikimate kinase
MNIILIGFMGAGKTTIAKILAKKLSFKNVDMDKIIIEKSGRTSDTEIFEKDGELTFREYEILVANELQDEHNLIISTGGGIVMNKVNIDYLKKNGVVVYLKNTFETSKKRIRKHNPPPLFQDLKKAKELYDLRLPLYTFYADVIVETDDKPLHEVADEIISKNLYDNRRPG